MLTGIGCTDVRLVNYGSAAIFGGLVILVWAWKTRRNPSFERWTLAFPVIALFLVTNKVYSPQYSLWLLPWFALALPSWRLFLAFEASDVAVFRDEVLLVRDDERHRGRPGRNRHTGMVHGRQPCAARYSPRLHRRVGPKYPAGTIRRATAS
jgi:hypothetical protein